MALCTRNFDGPVNHLLSTFLPGKVFNPIITRDFHPPKPDPAGLLHIAKEWGLDDGGRRLIMVRNSCLGYSDSAPPSSISSKSGSVMVNDKSRMELS